MKLVLSVDELREIIVKHVNESNELTCEITGKDISFKIEVEGYDWERVDLDVITINLPNRV